MNNCATNYYASLAMAIADINGGTSANALVDSSSAKVKVVTDCTGGITVSLLANDDHDAIITVEKDMVLELGDKLLSFTEGGCLNLVAGTDVAIKGGVLERTVTSDIDAENTTLCLVQTAGKLRINGGAYQISGYHPNGFVAIKAANTCTLLEITDADVSAINSDGAGDAGVRAIQTQAKKCLVKRCTVVTDAADFSQGVFGMGVIEVEATTLSAHSRKNNARCISLLNGTLDVRQSTLTSHSDTQDTQTVYLAGGSATIDGCVISAVTEADLNYSAYAIRTYSGTVLKVKNTEINADAKHYTDKTETRSEAVHNDGTAMLENVVANATYTAVWNNGKLYVNGGSYKAFTYGGFVFCHGAEGEAFINDATLRGGQYEGIFDYSDPSYTSYGTMYIIGADTRVYMDGCTCDASDCHRSIIIRGVKGEWNNSLCISNSTVEDGTLNQGAIRIDNNTMMLSVGVGTNITSERFKNGFTAHDDEKGVLQYEVDYEKEGVVEYTGQLYRRQPDEYICNGRDLAAVTDWVSPVEKQLITTEGMDSITQTFERPANGEVEVFLYVPPVSGAVTSKATFKIGDMTLFEGFLMSNPSNCGTAFVEYHVRRDAPCNAVHYFTHGAGVVDLHASSIVPKDMADSVTVIAPAGTAFPKGTRLYVSVKEI